MKKMSTPRIAELLGEPSAVGPAIERTLLGAA